ncbi:hypothetical protein [Rhizobium sp. AB2/73]|uniref:hypothetical protein n=1 Tax=Rhizobium sp. AB2/73 TaxID=2795216 RepID=UPI000DDE569B|nr:hypothetical protein [Rhizobium sp. AB2/73]UEQ85924.1 hypothetical protein I8E17_35030 [Rhizobium sp. AB2/73]
MVGTMNSTRRFFLTAATSAILLPYLPKRASAIEPLTALQAGAAVVGIIAGIAGLGSDEEFKKKLAEISAKLDQIVRLQQSILSEIQALKLYITEAVVIGRRDTIANALNAQKDRFDILVASPVNRETRPLYDLLISNVEQSAFEISRFDFSAYIPFSTGVAIDLVINRILQVDSARQLVLKTKVHDVYNAWLDAGNPLSVTHLIAQIEDEIRTATAQLNAKGRVVGLRSYDKAAGRNRVCTWTTTLTVNGDFNTGFSGAISEVMGNCELLPDDRCGPRHPCFIGPDFEKSADMKATNIPAPIPENSGYALVDEFNHARNQIIDQMHRVANLYDVKSQIEKLRDTFA